MRTSRARAFLGTLLCAALVAVGLSSVGGTAVADPVPADPATPATVTADSLPTVQIDNGVVWTQAVVGNTVYAGGRFENVRPYGAAPGTQRVARRNFVAYDLTTGNMTGFAPSFNGQVLDVERSPDGSRLYVAGEFTQVNGQNRYRLAAFDTATGQLLSSFQGGADFRIRSVVATATTVYVGGQFNTANGVARTRLAAFRASDGALLPWAPTANDGQVMGIVMAPDQSRIVVGGFFTLINGANAYGMGAVDPVTGASMAWPANQIVRNGGPNATIYSLTTDATQVYGTGMHYGSGGNLEGTFAATSEGQVTAINSCRGDTYAAAAIGSVLYSTGHPHNCSSIGGLPQTQPWTFQRAMATTTGPGRNGKVNVGGSHNNRPAPDLLHWLPTMDAGLYTGQSQAGWHITGNSQYVVVGGEFPRVNNQRQEGLARFAIKEIAPNRQAPQGQAELLPTMTAIAPGAVRVRWQAGWDRDNERITYEVLRGATVGGATVVGRTTADTNWWTRPPMAITDTTAPPNTTQTYRVRMTDPQGNVVVGPTATFNVPSGTASLGAYAGAVLGDGATNYWRLGELSGTTAFDWAGGNDVSVNSNATRGVPGAVSGDPATQFPGSSGVPAASTTAVNGPQTFSVEAWVNTSSTRGGKIVGFGSSRTGNSSNYDRHVYMDDSGRITFGVHPGAVRVVTSPAGFNDGQWHHVVGTLGPAGQVLYVDGELTAQNANTTGAQPYTGYWRIGGDTANGWPSRGSSDFLAGRIDDVSVYPGALTAQQVAGHYLAAGGDLPNQPPVASFTAAAASLTASVDGSASSDVDGSLVSHSWNFGDGATATGATAQHTYAAPGTYTVTLTVTDDDGATGSTTRSVTVTVPPPNQPPTASFTTGGQFLTVTTDGSASADADGTVTSHAWDFGDGATATGVTAAHTYGAPGTYTVTLTVTDDDSAPASTTRSVTATEPPVVTSYATDTFERTTTNGLGTADSGGAWTVGGGATNFSVSGGQGRIRMGAAGAAPYALLQGVQQTDTELRVGLTLDKAQTGGGTYVSVLGRYVGGADYRVKLRYLADGRISATLVRNLGGETSLQQLTVPGGTFAAGERVQVRLQVTGSAPTTLRAKVWRATEAEPASWLLSATDTAGALQAAGSVGILTYLSASSTSAPIVASVDDLWAGPASAN